MLLRALPIKVWYIGVLLISILGLAFYLVLGKGTESSVSNSLLHQKQVIARAEAGNITSFFQAYGNSVAILAQLNTMSRQDEMSLRDMDLFVEQWRSSGLVAGVILTDKDGVVVLNSNVKGTSDTGDLLTDRDYFQWAKAKDRVDKKTYFIGRPVVSRLGASEGETIIPVAAPVYQDDIFSGVVVAATKLRPLTELYFGLLNVSNITDVYLISEDGSLLYSSSEEDALGENLITRLQGRPFLGSPLTIDVLKSALATSKEGTLHTKTHLVAYSPVLLEDQKILLVIASPAQIISEYTTPTYVRTTGVLLLVTLAVILFGITASRETRIREAKAYERQKSSWK